ncbi:MAG: chorismate mutase [Dehalococcoidia bacterium]
MLCRGIRGAITVDSNTTHGILAAGRELLEEMVAANDVHTEDVAAALFTTTNDLNAEFPARAAREMGWRDAPLICANEIAVPGSLERCLRILLLINTEKRADEIVHVYLKGARVLRPDREYDPQG